jgi:transcriptional regulator with XRE-family HTH domain
MLKSLHTQSNQVFLAMLRRRRQALHLRQADVAQLLGRGQSTVSKIERGVRRLDIIELRAWLAALEVDFLDFMGELDRRLESQLAVDPRPRRRRGAGGRRMSRSNPSA